jgi:hypothetical protein
MLIVCSIAPCRKGNMLPIAAGLLLYRYVRLLRELTYIEKSCLCARATSAVQSLTVQQLKPGSCDRQPGVVTVAMLSQTT